MSAGDPLRVQFMGNLAVNLNALFHATGDLAHVMEAIDVARRAAEATAGQDDPRVRSGSSPSCCTTGSG
ncbi:hypothetical protein RB201_20735 [Streptomyces sp. S1A(2023)]